MVARKKSNANGAAITRVFVGTSPGGEDAEACVVLEHSLRRCASGPVEIDYLTISRGDQRLAGYGWHTNTWSTPWTGLRWAVPELCGWEGKAVYFDCPTIVTGDVTRLAQTEFPAGVSVLARIEGTTVRTGCLVFDCKAAKRWMPSIEELRGDSAAHQRVAAKLASRRSLLADLPVGWGLRDADYSRNPEACTGAVHCANPYMQPHVGPAIRRLRARGRTHWFDGVRVPHFSKRLVELFHKELAEALASGYDIEDYEFEPDYGTYDLAGGWEGSRKAS